MDTKKTTTEDTQGIIEKNKMQYEKALDAHWKKVEPVLKENGFEKYFFVGFTSEGSAIRICGINQLEMRGILSEIADFAEIKK